MIGEKLGPILRQIEDALWEFELNKSIKPQFSNDDLRAASKIFMSVLMDKMWELQEKEGIDMLQRENIVKKAGEDLRLFIKTYTNLDSHEFYN